jgi:hypothetical protein
MGTNDGAGAEKKERRGWEKGCRVGGGLGRVMTWMAVRPENGTENKVLYDFLIIAFSNDNLFFAEGKKIVQHNIFKWTKVSFCLIWTLS